MDVQNKYYRTLVKFGIGAMIYACIANFIPPIYISAKYGTFPGLSGIFKLWGLVAATYGISWIVQPTAYFPTVGVAGSYVGWLAGSVGDIRMTSANMALKSAEYEADTHEGKVIANLATCTSVFVSVAAIMLFTLIGGRVVPLLPQAVLDAFNYILPALFGSIYIDLLLKNPRGGLLTIACIAVILLFSGNILELNSGLVTILAVALGILANRVIFVYDKNKSSVKID
ncbi:hypothetical protein GOQ29_12640 [Clostridium sp. D2Q-14]|uniref:hypothetical protein n=1 Tax=Anaeromonas gelatinilytica TaxID=2683194 RepID=UPI00193C2154|nr:hypothetical protein [Anaeromonas gelatinilytica]MBS4536467.1 hypothetical protein [Anaeromonas gelatinilytica]